MAAGTIPIKTLDGQGELDTRQRRVSQRHRTVLFLVDGKRSAVEVRSLALRAGVPETCFDELLALGLIMLPEPAVSRRGEDPPPRVALNVGLPLPGLPGMPGPRDPRGPIGQSAFNESPLAASRTLGPESIAGDSLQDDSRDATDPWAPSQPAGLRCVDAAFAEARAILMQAVRSEAPLSGSLTLLRLRRARSRSDLAALLDEVEGRILKRHRTLAGTQTLSRVRHLLTEHRPAAGAGLSSRPHD